MALPAPMLDDRHFQQFVDDAKRYIQERCEDWTDHNVSDPGITLIEAVAQMVDQLVYRLNRVPDRHYVKFLELIGVELLPPAAARGEVTFWLSAPQPHTVTVRAETEVATPRTDVEDPTVFTTVAPLDVLSCTRSFAGHAKVGSTPEDATIAMERGGFACFSTPPLPDDALLVGLSNAVPSCAVRLDFDCRVKGIGVDPRDAPLAWESWNGTGWSACEVDVDETGGLNRPGAVVLHVPSSHVASVMTGQRAGWLRCRVLTPRPKQPTYTDSPEVTGLTAATVGGTVEMVNAEVVHGEILGISDGTPAQAFHLQRSPAIPWDEPARLECTSTDGVEEWSQIEDFAAAGPTDRVFRLDPVGGVVQFGPVVRQADGTLESYGQVPPKGAVLRLVTYRTGGGRAGNVVAGQVSVLKTSVPYVSHVTNRGPANGGFDGESLDNAKTRAPLMLRSRGRAVTGEDFELLAREAAPDAARVRCIPASTSDEAGGVRLVVVPHAAGDDLGRLQPADLVPPDAMLARIAAHLNERRMVGTRLLITAPEYAAFTAVVTVSAAPGYDRQAVRLEVLTELYRFFDPVRGGVDGTGWPFGRPVQEHDVLPILQRACLDTTVRPRVHLFSADAETWDRTEVERVEVSPHGLVFSYDHQVIVSPS